MINQTIVLLALYLLLCIGLWKLFQKAGVIKSWSAFIPFYNLFVWLKLIKRPWWWLFLFIVPGVNFLMLAVLSIQLAKAFGRKGTIELTIAALLPYVYLPYIAFNKEVKFTGPEDLSKQKKSAAKEWTDAIIFAVVAATIIRTFFIEAFTIPTSSLEKTLLVGDYLFVSKLSYGPKLPNTPLSFPFAHHTLPLTKNTKSYLEWIKLPYLRLPGFGKVKNNDIVVFNYPDGDTVASNLQDQSYYQILRDEAYAFKSMDMQAKRPLRNEEYYKGLAREYMRNPNNAYHFDQSGSMTFGEIVARPPDKRENYIKRCVAIAGDTMQIKQGVVYINGKPGYASPTMQHTYRVISEGTFNKKMLDDWDITEQPRFTEDGALLLTLTEEKAQRIRKLHSVKDVSIVVEDSLGLNPYGRIMEIFPHSRYYPWNKDNFGPLVLPKEGMTVKLDTINIALYDRLIDIYEENDLQIKNGTIFINGQAADSYTFKMNYYFMMGDNRHNSADSRYWGLVPEDHVVGKPVFIWMSLKDPKYNPMSGEFKLNTFFTDHGKARWERFFTRVNNEGISRSYLIHFLVIMGGMFAYSYFSKKRRQRKAAKS